MDSDQEYMYVHTYIASGIRHVLPTIVLLIIWNISSICIAPKRDSTIDADSD